MGVLASVRFAATRSGHSFQEASRSLAKTSRRRVRAVLQTVGYFSLRLFAAKPEHCHTRSVCACKLHVVSFAILTGTRSQSIPSASHSLGLGLCFTDAFQDVKVLFCDSGYWRYRRVHYYLCATSSDADSPRLFLRNLGRRGGA